MRLKTDSPARLRIAPGDEFRNDEVVAPAAESQRRALSVRDLAAGRRDHRMAGRDVPFAGRRQPGIDIGRPSATRPNLTAEPSSRGPRPAGRDEGFGPGIAMQAADRRIQGWPGGGQGRVRIGSLQRLAPWPSVSRSAPRPTMPRQINPSAGAPTMPSSGVPPVTSARLTVNSLRPATNSLVPSSGSIRKKLPWQGTAASAARSSDSDGMPGAAGPGLRR